MPFIAMKFQMCTSRLWLTRKPVWPLRSMFFRGSANTCFPFTMKRTESMPARISSVVARIRLVVELHDRRVRRPIDELVDFFSCAVVDQELPVLPNQKVEVGLLRRIVEMVPAHEQAERFAVIAVA